VGVARALYQRPDLLLADEPVSALDPTLADATLGALVAQAEATGATLVASLHAVDLALRWFPRVVGLREGALAFDRPTAEVTPALLEALYASEGGPATQAPPGGAGAASMASSGAASAPVRRPAPVCR